MSIPLHDPAGQVVRLLKGDPSLCCLLPEDNASLHLRHRHSVNRRELKAHRAVTSVPANAVLGVVQSILVPKQEQTNNRMLVSHAGTEAASADVYAMCRCRRNNTSSHDAHA